jgi:glycosyltransferase involved in cell wall biosynthesis
MINERGAPRIATVILSWQRPDLLRRTIESYRARTTVAHRLLLVDNGSDAATRDVIIAAQECGAIDRVVWLADNRGGEALNLVFDDSAAPFLHFSENDLEYRHGWDLDLLSKFEAFPSLGQLSVFSAEPESASGEIGPRHEAVSMERGGRRVWRAAHNVGTSSMVRREVADLGVRWHNLEAGGLRWPDDGRFSTDVKAAGYLVAWNDRHVVTNWGHNVGEWSYRLDYYLADFGSKPWVGLEGLERMLRAQGYALDRAPSGAICGIRPTDEAGPR